MFRETGKISCDGKATMLLCGVSLETWSTIYCSNLLPAPMAMSGEPPQLQRRRVRDRKEVVCIKVSSSPDSQRRTQHEAAT